MIDSQPAEGSTLATTKPRDNNFKGVNSGQGGSNDSSKCDFSKNKDNVWCTYRKKPQHTKETCWKLHGKPWVSTVLVVLKGDNSEAKCM